MLSGSFNLRAHFQNGSVTGEGHGKIQIGESNGYTIPVTWQLYAEDGKVLAVSGLRIYVRDHAISRADILERARSDVETFHINRRKIFSQVEITLVGEGHHA